MNHISILFEDPQVTLIQDIEKSIQEYSLKETIDCEISAVELRRDRFSDEAEEHKDLDLVVQSFEALAKLAENLSVDATTTNGCRDIRQNAKEQFLAAIKDIKVM